MTGKKENYLGYLKSISSDLGELKKSNENIINRFNKIEETINDRNFQRGLDFLERHEGDQESLINILGKNYGYEKKYSGWDLFEKVLEYWARKLEKNYNFEKEINNGIIKKLIDFSWKAIGSVIISIIVIIISGKAGLIAMLANIFK
jgi:hypothetical protein